MSIANTNISGISSLPSGVEVHIMQSPERGTSTSIQQKQDVSPSRITSQKRREEEKRHLLEMARQQEEYERCCMDRGMMYNVLQTK